MKKNKQEKKKNQRAASRTSKRNSIPLTHIIFVVIALIATYFSFTPLKENKLINWDDDKYITYNQDIRSLDSEHLRNLLTNYYEGNYHPVTMLSLALNYSSGELNPQSYLYTNLFFHLCNVLLVFIFVRKLTGQGAVAFIASMMFGIHPLHVESVAWASERKDVLYCFFFLLSLITYLQYLKKYNWAYFIASLACFTLSLLSKAMAVPLAVVIVFLDFFYSRKSSMRLWLEKIPFFTLAVIFGIIALRAQKVDEYVAENSLWTFTDRLAIASHNFVNYIIQLIVPHDLSIIYPYPEKLSLVHWASFGFMILLLAATIYFMIKKYPYTVSQKIYLFGFLFFVVNILLVLQLIQVGNAVMADRYTYVSYIGLFIIIGYLIGKLTAQFREYRYLIYAGLGVYLLFLAVFTHERTAIWHDSSTLWSETVKKYPTPVGYVNLGSAEQIDKGNIEEGYANYKKAIEMDSSYALAWHNMASVHLSKKEFDTALRLFNKAISLNPDYVNSYGARGQARFFSGDFRGAVEDYDKYISKTQANPDVYYLRGQAKFNLKEYKLAIEDFDKAIEVGTKQQSPNTFVYYMQRGTAKEKDGQYEGALADYNTALLIAPNSAQAFYNLGNLECTLGEKTNNATKKAEGCEHLQRAFQLGHLQAQNDLSKFCK